MDNNYRARVKNEYSMCYEDEVSDITFNRAYLIVETALEENVRMYGIEKICELVDDELIKYFNKIKVELNKKEIKKLKKTKKRYEQILVCTNDYRNQLKRKGIYGRYCAKYFLEKADNLCDEAIFELEIIDRQLAITHS